MVGISGRFTLSVGKLAKIVLEGLNRDTLSKKLYVSPRVTPSGQYFHFCSIKKFFCGRVCSNCLGDINEKIYIGEGLIFTPGVIRVKPKCTTSAVLDFDACLLHDAIVNIYVCFACSQHRARSLVVWGIALVHCLYPIRPFFCDTCLPMALANLKRLIKMYYRDSGTCAAQSQNTEVVYWIGIYRSELSKNTLALPGGIEMFDGHGAATIASKGPF